MPGRSVRAALQPTGDPVVQALAAGLAAIRHQYDIPAAFTPTVLAHAETAARSPAGIAAGTARSDLTDIPFVTLDPASSTDLDQAFHIEARGEALVLHYAIADVFAFVVPGDPVDQESWRRGVTLYLPDGKAGLHPPALAEGAASLLPDGPRPAVTFSVEVDPDGSTRLQSVHRALVRSRAKLAYDTVTPDELPAGFAELARRVALAEERRGASRVDLPEQEVRPDGDGRWTLELRSRLPTEDTNAALSLATNLSVADALLAAATGIFRVMPVPDDRQIRRLRHTARAFGLDWAPTESLADLERRLDRADPRVAAFQLAVRRVSGGASYAAYGAQATGGPPLHAALGATYTHATAPLRRLVDRYVIEAALAVTAGRAVPSFVTDAFDQLPAVMERAEQRAAQVDRAVIDLVEAVLLHGREGEVLDAVVTDIDDRGARIQLCEHAVVSRVSAHRVLPGDAVRVRLEEADPATRRLRFERVG